MQSRGSILHHHYHHYHYEVYFRQKSIITMTTLQNKRQPWSCYNETYRNMHTHTHTRTHTLSILNVHKSNMLELLHMRKHTFLNLCNTFFKYSRQQLNSDKFSHWEIGTGIARSYRVKNPSQEKFSTQTRNQLCMKYVERECHNVLFTTPVKALAAPVQILPDIVGNVGANWDSFCTL